MYHTAYVTTWLNSPHGRSAVAYDVQAPTWVRADVFLPWANNDLGFYGVRSVHEFHCDIGGDVPAGESETSTLVRMTQWAALRSDTTTVDPVCGRALRTRYYQGLDQYGWIPNKEFWVLNESFTYKEPVCGEVIIGGNNNYDVGFLDDLSIRCADSNCYFATDQTFSVARTQLLPTKLVKGKNCIGKTEAQCIAQPQHTGWHTQVTATAIAVTDNP